MKAAREFTDTLAFTFRAVHQATCTTLLEMEAPEEEKNAVLSGVLAMSAVFVELTAVLANEIDHTVLLKSLRSIMRHENHKKLMQLAQDCANELQRVETEMERAGGPPS